MTIAAQYYVFPQFGKDDTLRRYGGDRQVDRVRKTSLPSPEEGRRLIQAFVRIERPDLREEILNFVTEMLGVQNKN
jgi:hypothetical protein